MQQVLFCHYQLEVVWQSLAKTIAITAIKGEDNSVEIYLTYGKADVLDRGTLKDKSTNGDMIDRSEDRHTKGI